MPEARRLRVFFDADALVAGSASATGASFLLLYLADLGVVEGITSHQAIGEVERNLTAKLPTALPAFRVIASSALTVVSDPRPATLRQLSGQAAGDDLPILGAAVERECDYLVTFNVRHFRRGASPPSPIRPADLVAKLRGLLSD